MAITKAKRSIKKKQSAVSRQSTAGRDLRQSANTRKNRHRTKPRNKPYPGEFALQEKQLPSRRFVDFPQVVGKTIRRLHFYSSTDYHCITLDLQDKTALNLEIESGFTLNAQLQQINKGEVNILAEWPAISSQS